MEPRLPVEARDRVVGPSTLTRSASSAAGARNRSSPSRSPHDHVKPLRNRSLLAMRRSRPDPPLPQTPGLNNTRHSCAPSKTDPFAGRILGMTGTTSSARACPASRAHALARRGEDVALLEASETVGGAQTRFRTASCRARTPLSGRRPASGARRGARLVATPCSRPEAAALRFLEESFTRYCGPAGALDDALLSPAGSCGSSRSLLSQRGRTRKRAYSFFERRLGPKLERFIEPFVGGIFADSPGTSCWGVARDRSLGEGERKPLRGAIGATADLVRTGPPLPGSSRFVRDSRRFRVPGRETSERPRPRRSSATFARFPEEVGKSRRLRACARPSG
jgi:hypothetical protein